MSWEPATNHESYQKDNLEQAAKNVNEAISLIEESKPSGSWLILMMLRWAASWSLNKSKEL